MLFPPSKHRADFWQYAHDLTVKFNSAKGKQAPSQMMRQYNHKMAAFLGHHHQHPGRGGKIKNEMDVSYYGDLDRIFTSRSKSKHPLASHQIIGGSSTSLDSANHNNPGPSKNCHGSNVTLEDVFYCLAAPSMGTPFTHSAHIFKGKLNYILSYHTAYVNDQRMAFMIRDEIINILRMAVE